MDCQLDKLCVNCLKNLKESNYDLITASPSLSPSYNQLKIELGCTINCLNDLKHRFDMRKEFKMDDITFEIKLMRKQINSRAHEIIELIKQNRAKLLSLTQNMEDYLMRNLNEIKVENYLFTKNIDTKLNLYRNEFKESELNALKDDLNTKKIDLKFKMDLVDNIDQFELYDNDDDLIFGIRNINWKTEPKNAKEHLRRGISMYKQLKDYTGALKYFNKSLQTKSKLNPAAYNWKGRCYYELKQYNKAIDCYNKAIEIDPFNKVSYCNKGASYRELKEYQKANKCFDKTIKLDPKCFFAYFNKGVNFYHETKYNEAIEYFNAAIELRPTDPICWNWKGNCFNELRDLNKALKCFNKAIQIDPNYENAYANKRSSLTQIKNMKLFEDYSAIQIIDKTR